MSDEGGVAPSDVVQDITQQKVTPVVGKGALGTWRAVGSLGLRAEISYAVIRPRLSGKPRWSGADMRQHLSFLHVREGPGRTCQGQNRTREIRPSGIVGGLEET